MNVDKRNYPVIFALLILMHTSFAFAQDVQKPKYAADVPEFLLTPDKVETDLLGTSNFSMVCLMKLRFRKALTFLTYPEA
jgi:hypothetical protein